MNTSRHVVAGVASVRARPVVRFAAAEANARHTELRLVTARPAQAAPELYLPNEIARERDVEARQVLADLAAEVTAEWPGLPVTTEIATGPPASALRAAAREAELLVVGADDAGPFMEAISGSVPGELMTTSWCPLVVMPRHAGVTPESAPVVAAFDEPETSRAALAYAFAAAARTGRPLTVLHCGTDEPFDESRALMGFRELYPDVTVTVSVDTAAPRDALTAASRSSAVLVLGSRGRGALASGLFGSVSRDLIRHSACPVVVARAAGVNNTAVTS